MLAMMTPPLSSMPKDWSPKHFDFSPEEKESLSPPLKHDSPPKLDHNNPSLYKTELCRSFSETGYCRYGNKCQFAHGLQDLRPIARHRKYKTEKCKNFEKDGVCPYGPRCRFIHNEDGTRNTTPFLSPFSSESGSSSSPPQLSLAGGVSPNPLPAGYTPYEGLLPVAMGGPPPMSLPPPAHPSPLSSMSQLDPEVLLSAGGMSPPCTLR
eukprot:TRINITY_DN1742_c0_g2_i1.p1 TRINITY_DN1742_c0_g2~~TRINITY_DN1742_c0_g2_i1.p1  ORF type:complete len:209 (-),score=16.65 TRINITY_DN1742_c0_g2_i1:15-641(-)